jgi:TolB-like protein
MKSYQKFFAELKRRKVFKVAAVYGAVAFALIQIADPLGEAMRLPETFLPFIIAILLLGFPVAIVLAWAFEVTPEGVQRTDAAAPGEIEAIVAEPASQRWPAGLLALAGTAALLAAVWWTGLSMGRADSAEAGAEAVAADSLQLVLGAVEEDARPSIAVLPFEDMSQEGDQEYFSDGMTEELLNTLANIRELRVSGRTSAFAYKEQVKDLREIGKELGVRYLVEGSVRKSGDQLRITAQLIDAGDGSHLWSETYDRRFVDVFAIQTEIAESVAEKLRVPLGLAGDDLLVTPTADLEAYDLYLAGRSAMRARGPSLADAVRLFEAAIARDSTWSPAWAALAEATELTVWYPASIPEGVTQADHLGPALDAAEAAARRALALDSRNASAHVALGSVHRDRAEWKAAEESFLRALALDPDDAEAHHQYGEYLLNVGRIAEAVRALDRAAALDPAPIRLGMLAFGLAIDGRLDESIDVREMILRQAPSGSVFEASTWRLARRYMVAGRWDEAVDAIHQGNQRRGASGPRIGTRSDIERHTEALRRGDLSAVPSSAAAEIELDQWMILGLPDSAVAAWFRQSESRPFGRVIELRYPHVAPIRSDPRIVQFLAERGLADAEEVRTPEGERVRPAVLRQYDERGAP